MKREIRNYFRYTLICKTKKMELESENVANDELVPYNLNHGGYPPINY